MRPVVTLTGGMTTPANQRSQMFSFDDTIFEYNPNHSSSQQFIIGGFIGEEYTFNKSWAWQFGLAFYDTVTSIKGEETQAPAANPNAINFWDYHYKIASHQLLFENKLLFSVGERYHPYLLAGLGESFNHAKGFQATPQNSGEVATAIYKNHQSHSFIYTIGLGLDIDDVFEKMRIGVGYRFANLGKYSLGTGTLDTGLGGSVFSIPALQSNQLFNHEILIQLTYFI